MPEPVWPSVEQQVADTRATPGSALEQLIRENQDFDVLDEREAEDKLPFPPWLRVYLGVRRTLRLITRPMTRVAGIRAPSVGCTPGCSHTQTCRKPGERDDH